MPSWTLWVQLQDGTTGDFQAGGAMYTGWTNLFPTSTSEYKITRRTIIMESWRANMLRFNYLGGQSLISSVTQHRFVRRVRLAGFVKNYACRVFATGMPAEAREEDEAFDNNLLEDDICFDEVIFGGEIDDECVISEENSAQNEADDVFFDRFMHQASRTHKEKKPIKELLPTYSQKI
ncbi:hypothetical protein DM02DRAFT_634039 [Periconia macrospinosa]|uniref:Uncharacterized protein n=1 Tax=Periconia macrospinosa TaxID=97972 RepID=A0A2V1D951_9PLEO|nr:hypothetical protein DM02DRAFT_634039 [Periconia macrospinosa]